MRSTWSALFLLATAARAWAAETADFDRDVRSILFARCVKCHGGAKPEAGLRLNDRDAATAMLDSGHRAIVPGHPEQSELLQRVTSTDPDVRMPPLGEPLKPAEIEAISRWIASGAEWPAHWAYRPLKRVDPPVVENGWAKTSVDQFILHNLHEHGLNPSPMADRRTLLRRVSLDLLGLPPTPDELDAFQADDSSNAYDRAVDRLLASPHYGERWARHWMDVVHYAETHGHDQDRPREHAWRYRDYLIGSLNEDLPYARFVQEQVAGDVLLPGDARALTATGFLAAGPWDESSLRDIRPDGIDRLIGQYLDRDDIVTATMNTFVSTTVQCARCHDHKFDPVSQREYYALQAVFAGIDKANRAFDPDPAIAARRTELAEQLRELNERIKTNDSWLLQPELQARAAVWEAARPRSTKWQVLQPIEYRATDGSALTLQSDGSLLASGDRPEKDTYIITARCEMKQITGVRIELLTDDNLPMMGPGRADNGNLHLNEVKVFALGDADASPSASENLVKLRNPAADFDQDGWTIAHAIDNNPATAWGIHPEEGKPHEASFEVDVSRPLPSDRDTGAITLRFELQQIHGRMHLIGRVRLSVTDSAKPFSTAKLPPEITATLDVSQTDRTDQQRAQLAGYVERLKIESLTAELPPLAMVYCGTNRFAADGSFKPAEKPHEVRLLRRGQISQPEDVVAPGTLSCLLDVPFSLTDTEDEGARRAALAQWLSDPQNGLTWRSIANRIWHYHFGRGLVATPSDFGRMGAAPTHPELLDWLAVELRDHSGSLKHLHRLIVTSQVYQQASNYDSEFARIDSENHYLWRMNRRRLDAESIRDSLLVLSGTLDPTLGGPSVKQFIQSPGIHVTPKVDYLGVSVDDAAYNRRSVYRFVFRTLPDPFLETFDCPDASQFTPQRNESVSALQALAMLHDKFVIRQSERITEALTRQDQVEKQLTILYQTVFGRAPTPAETSAVVEYAKQHGLANACRFLLNSNEFLFVD